ncbi:hypothetical protein ERO13_A11G297325v2 [Gossypium hirsutum]|uniref:Uncharacterized protein n=1 Tax=Gossypium tomentosum TaxID=34277 RepID=A0A5D2NIU4_GOSTO|nr:hypothetical protein ERO13_A11G297325v2 [Gossypium hirsutum]TYI03629.1 hypothetical protein ES332_A11G353000v1 [Gossypium tomentosum]
MMMLGEFTDKIAQKVANSSANIKGGRKPGFAIKLGMGTRQIISEIIEIKQLRSRPYNISYPDEV